MSSRGKKLVSGSMFRIVTFFYHLVVGFFLTPFVIQSLGDRMYGFWILVGSFIGYYGLLDLGLSNAISRHISRAIGADDREELNRVFNTGLFLFVGIGLVALLITIILAAFAGRFVHDPEEAKLFQVVILILGVNTAIDLPIWVFHGMLNAKLQFNVGCWISIIGSIIRTSLIVCVLASGYKIVALALVTFAANLIPNVLYVRCAIRDLPGIKLSFKFFRKKTVEKLGSYSIFVFINKMGDQLRFHSDALVITSFLGLAASAHYNIAAFLIGYFSKFMGQIMGVLTPYFSQRDGANDRSEMIQSLLLSMKISICIATFIAFGLLFWGRAFIHVWMGEEYIDAYPCLVILALGMMVCQWNSPSYALVLGTSKHKITSIFSIAEGLFNLMLSMILVIKFGIVGVAIGTCVPLLVISLILMPMYVCKVYKISRKTYFFNIYRSAIISFLALLLPYLVTMKYLSYSYLSLIGVGALTTVWYALCSWFLLFKKEEKSLFISTLSRKRAMAGAPV